MIIGITGSFGAGKGAVVDYLVSQKGFKHYSARNFILEEVKRQGLDISKGREVTILVANELRKKYGPAYIVESLYNRAMKDGGDSVIESLRAVEEAKKIHELGGIVIGVDADPKIRYARAVRRGSETDHVTYEEWIAQEKMESNPNDPTKQDIFGALKESDFIVGNDGSLSELHTQIDKILEPLGI